MNIYRHGDLIIKPAKEKRETKNLECGCHRVLTNGEIESCIIQESKAGQQGFRSIKTENWIKLNPVKTKKGYLQLTIHGKIWRVHRLIASMFLSNPNNFEEVLHINDVKDDNRISNLKWGNAKENVKDRIKNGTHVFGSKSPNSKLTEKSALEVYKSNLSLSETAKKHGISKKLVLLIKQKQIWKHIHGDVFLNQGNNIALAFGEQTGHSHTLKSNSIRYFGNLGAIEYFEIDEPTDLTHQEHETLTILPGNYDVIIEREYDYFENELKKVVD